MNIAQRAANSVNMKTLFEITKNICSVAVKDKHSITTEDSKKLERRRQHFEEIVNWEPPENPMEINNDLTLVIKSITTEPISAEVRMGITALKDWKAGGVDNIVAKLLKADLETSSHKLHEIINIIWEEEVPEKWLKGLFLTDCKDPWRGITLLAIASKVTR